MARAEANSLGTGSSIDENGVQALSLFPPEQNRYLAVPPLPYAARFPRTRYQGSKRKLLGWIWWNVRHIEFGTVLDAFGGTGSVSYLFKCAGKAVTFNDSLSFNHQVGLGLIENRATVLSREDVEWITQRHGGVRYNAFISETFADIYFTDSENQWLDAVAQNIQRLPCRFKRALAYFALGQACIAKRPYNLFHRKNLYVRTADVPRSFGNKATWDKPFEEHFETFVSQANRAVFDNRKPCVSVCRDVEELPTKFDLVYLDPPYVSAAGAGVDYFHFYHFLEGLTDYDSWARRVDYATKHRKLSGLPSPWADKRTIGAVFERALRRFSASILVISYRTDGIPTEEELLALLARCGKKVVSKAKTDYKYVLSHRNSAELLLVAV